MNGSVEDAVLAVLMATSMLGLFAFVMRAMLAGPADGGSPDA